MKTLLNKSVNDPKNLEINAFGFYKRNINMIEGITPRAVAIGSPGRRAFWMDIDNVSRTPMRIRINDKVPAKIPKFTRAFETTIE